MRRPFTLLEFRAALASQVHSRLVLGSIVVWLALWFSISSWWPSTFFPGPVHVAGTFADMFGKERFAIDVLASSLRILLAFVASALIAVPLGIFMSCFRLADSVAAPLVDFVRYIPVPALAPLFVLWAGIGEGSKFLVLFFGTFFQLVLLVKDDADEVPEVFFDLARTMGASPFQLIRDVLVPATLPLIYDRLRVTLGWCWTYLVIAELIAVHRGIGHAIKEAQRFNASDRLFVCFITLGIIGLLTDFAAKRSFKRLFPYA